MRAAHIHNRRLRVSVFPGEYQVLHSDFAPWNILFDGDECTGILDFEATHLNVRVADFAMSWRGYYDDVVHGYEEVHKLTDLDWQLLVPTFWSWLFISARDHIERTPPAELRRDSFSWQIK
ncbi:MAG: phosphotransferase [Candidatus Latescibacterota bacterium]